MTKEEAINEIIALQNSVAELPINKDMQNAIMQMLVGCAKIVSKINDADKVCDLMIGMLNEGLIETRDIGKVNTMIRKAIEEI